MKRRHSQMKAAGLALVVASGALTGCFGPASDESGSGSDEQSERLGTAADLMGTVSAQTSALDLFPALADGELAPEALELNCGNPASLKQKVEEFISQNMNEFVQRNRCSLAGHTSINQLDEQSSVRQGWRFIFGVGGSLTRRESLFESWTTGAQGNTDYRRSTFVDWTNRVSVGVQIRFPRQIDRSVEDCDAVAADKYVRHNIIDSIDQDYERLANAACTLATLGADSHVIDTAQICQLRISDALKQELIASELNRCGIEDADVCGTQGLPTVLADLTPESAVCYAGTTYRKEKGGSWNFLDSAQIVAGNYDVSVSLNIFSYNWGGLQGRQATHSCVRPVESPKFRAAGLVLETNLNRLKRQAGCGEESFTYEFTNKGDADVPEQEGRP